MRSPAGESQLATDPIECRQGEVEVLVGVGGGHDRPDPRLVEGDRGKTIGWAKTPSSKSRSLNRAAVVESPIMTGVIGVSDAPVSKPSRASSALNRRVLVHNRSISSGLVLEHVDRLEAGRGDRRRV